MPQSPKQQHDGHDTGYRHQIACARELSQHVLKVGARGCQEIKEHAHLAEDGQGGEQYNNRGIHQAFGHNGANALRERRAFAAFQRAAARHLANARHNQTRGITKEYRIDAGAPPWQFAQRCQCHLPAQGAQNLWQHAEDERNAHPPPVHLVENGIQEITPVRAAIHPPHDAHAKDEGQEDFYRIFQ